MTTTFFTEDTKIPEEFKLKKLIEQKTYIQNGRILEWQGAMQDVYSPMMSTDAAGTLSPRLLGRYPLLTRKEALEGLDGAVHAFDSGRGAWPTMSVAERIACVEKFAIGMRDKRQEVVLRLMWEIGKSYEDSLREFDRTVEYIQDTVRAMKELDRSNSRMVIEQSIIAQIRRAPLGVVLCMGPFNYPLNETFTTLIPALIMGNVVIFKPPKIGVLLHEPLLELFREFFPAGVVNAVYGDGPEVITPLMESGKVDALAFIGSSRISNVIRKQHPKPNRLRCVLGLEAKNVGIVLDDANLEQAVSESLLGTLSFNGQRCTALKILFVHERCAREFSEKYVQGLAQLKRGMPWEKGVKLTPLAEPGKTDYLKELVEDAVAHGAQVINPGGGEVSGTYFHPAVLMPVSKKMRVYREEQFGPVVPIVPFRYMDEVIRYMVESDYGQQVSIFGTDPKTIAGLIDHLVNQVCRVNINSQCQRGPDTFPFTGRKDSAEGTLSVSDALRVFSIRTLVAAKEHPINKEIIHDIVYNHESSFLNTDFIL